MLVPLGKGIGNRAMARGTTWLRAIGRWSYEIYLFHMLAILGLMAWFKQGERSGLAIVGNVHRHAVSKHSTRLSDLALLL